MKYSLMIATLLATSSFLVGCGSSNNGPASSSAPTVASSEDSSESSGDSSSEAAVYAFKNTSDEDTVSYSGQIARHVIMDEIKKATGAIVAPDTADNLGKIKNLYSGDDHATIDATIIASSKAGDLAIQKMIGDISSGKNLRDKIAGGYINSSGELKGEPTRLISPFFGWEGLASDATPDIFVNYIFDKLDANIMLLSPVKVDTKDGMLDIPTYTDAYGVDYVQLLQKFLLMSVGFSQGTTDYLKQNFAAQSGQFQQKDGQPIPPYSIAEHHFDEGFGYFGGARDSLALTKEQISSVFNDSNVDGMIDLNSEYNFGQSVNCAKRERGKNNFTSRTMQAFIDGREIVAKMTVAAEGMTPDEAVEATKMYQDSLNMAIKDAAVTWEECIAATVIHYINVTTDDIDAFDEGKFASLKNFEDLAKHWSEMKGFAFGLQFSPFSPFRESEEKLESLKTVLAKMGNAPVLPNGTQAGEAKDIEAYKADLMSARAVLKDMYGFSQEDVNEW